MQLTDPLLSDADLAAFIEACDPCEALSAQLLSLKQRLGPYASPYLGSGFEYQEFRPYQPGDPIKQLNWRYFARTGRLYTRLYEQERQARLLVAVDLRSSVRFGTRVRLKAAQAVPLTLALVHEASSQGMGVQLQPLLPEGTLSPVYQGAQAFEQAVALLNQPCPPDPQAVSSWESLALAVEQLPAGSLIVLIGDFWDLERTFVRWLMAQAPHKVTSVVWIYDQAERTLPADEMVLYDLTDSHPVVMNASTAAAYQDWAAQRWAQKRAEMMREGLPLYTLDAHESLKGFDHG